MSDINSLYALDSYYSYYLHRLFLLNFLFLYNSLELCANNPHDSVEIINEVFIRD